MIMIMMVRTVRLRHTRLQGKQGGGVREVTQHQYTSWPDHGTPTNIAPVLSFIKKSSAACQVRTAAMGRWKIFRIWN